MSNSQISIFNFNSNPVRVEIFEQQPHFCLLDVCSIFEIQNSRRVQSEMLDPQGVRQAYILAKDGKQRKTSFINEPNLYRIIFRSEKPIAKEFQNWVFEEVLPQIRKTGSYSQNSTAIQPVAADLQQIIQTAVQNALPPQMPLYQARNLHEVLPLAALYSKACTLAKDFKQLYKFLQQKGYGSMAEICLNHAEELNEHTALMCRVDGCIQILMRDLSDKDQEFIHRLFLK